MSRNDTVGDGVSFERYGRITGYASKLTRWNNAKLAEKHDRVNHMQGGIPNGDAALAAQP